MSRKEWCQLVLHSLPLNARDYILELLGCADEARYTL